MNVTVETHRMFSKMYTEKVQKQQEKVCSLHQQQIEHIRYLRYKPYSKYPNAYEVFGPDDYIQKITQAEFWLKKYKIDYAEYLL